MKDKIKEIFESNGLFLVDIPVENADKILEKLSTLIQESNEEAVRGFAVYLYQWVSKYDQKTIEHWAEEYLGGNVKSDGKEQG